ncbi:S1C family serine protease [Agromyces sp. Marseille-P2726]|uniref:S1C family serine protease n=1 Tax=Agromyces sp. Marseille-P2726 TaxID=2709132 RepID=UPI00156E7D98|nr:trypsin-like peptidase domain-containing protein [Agromyces sp. Marseille-P2726]
MTDTTDGPVQDPRESGRGDNRPANEPAAAPAAPAAPDVAAPAAPAAPAASPNAPAASSAPSPATGTVYHPGQAPQPYHAAQYPHPDSPPQSGATSRMQPVNGAVPPAFGGPRPGETQPTTPLAGVPPYGPNGHAGPGGPNGPNGPHGPNGPGTASQPAAPKQRRVGLGVAAAIVAAALIGGASGAGITALITSDDGPVQTDNAGTSQSIVVNDTDSVNQITAVAAKASPSVVTISVAGGQGAGTGSGIILSDDGYVLTNTHVVTLDGATGDPVIQVKTDDGRLYDAELVGTDPLSDLAVIKLADASGLTPLEFADSDELNVGDTAIAIGAPLGLSGTVTNGIISALNRSIDVASSAAPTTPDESQGDGGESDSPFDFFFDLPNPDGSQPQEPTNAGQVSLPVIQTDAAINPGNSGGALLDSEGRLIGVNVAILSAGGASAQAGNIGVGFAVPSNLAERIAKEIIENGSATHGLLGATVTSAQADEESTTVGALITEVTPGGAAEQAGLQSGDIVTEFNGVRITDQTDLTAQVRALPGGAEADLTFTRDGDSQTISVTVGTFEG